MQNGEDSIGEVIGICPFVRAAIIPSMPLMSVTYKRNYDGDSVQDERNDIIRKEGGYQQA